MSMISRLESTTRLIVNGEEKASVATALAISASLSLTNVQQVGSDIQGDIDLQVDAGIGTLDFTWPFDISTALGNPIDIDLGSISIPLIGDVEVMAEFSYDLSRRQLCVALTLAGVVAVGKKCVTW
jgi:hypothetical protein